MIDPMLIIAFSALIVLSVALFITVRWAKHLNVTPLYTAELAIKRSPWLPNHLPIVHHTHHMLFHFNRTHDWTSEMCERMGGQPFQIKIMGNAGMTVLNRPELVQDVLKTHFEVFEKGVEMCENLRDVLGQGIFAVNGPQWIHQRKTASRLFTARSLRDSMAHSVQSLLPVLHRVLDRSIVSQTPIDLVRLLNRFTMEGFAKIGFGVDLHCLDAEQEHPFQAAFDGAQQILGRRFLYPRWCWKLMRWLNVGMERELQQHIQVINETVLHIIAESLQHRQSREAASIDCPAPSGPESANMVSLFLDQIASDGEMKNVDPMYLRDIVINFLIAGRDTTAQVLSWFFYELSQHPEVEQRIREEIKAHEWIHPTMPSMDEVQALLYLEAVLKETLRLHPPVPMNMKRSTRDVVLCDGTFIPKESVVAIPSYALGRAVHVWGPDAKQFYPERWIDPTDSSKLITVSTFKFNSFLAGPRMCLGMNLAMMEMKMLAVSVLSKYHFHMIPDQEVTYAVSVTLPMKNPLLVQVVPVE